MTSTESLKKNGDGTSPACRGAFTLIELLVVIVLIMILAGLAAAFLPAIGDSARAAQGATMLQQWILTARQKALRDQVPCGLRLIPYVDPVTNKPIVYSRGGGPFKAAQVRQCQYIEQPDDFAIPPAQTGIVGKLMTDPAPPPGMPLVRVYISDGGVMQIKNLVAIGDYLEILGNGLMHKISGIGVPGDKRFSGMTEIDVNSPILYPVSATRQWRIVRAPRATGDDLLQLPDGVIIDLKSNDPGAAWINALPVRGLLDPIDILFSPSGAVISPGFTSDTINLWVREYYTIPKPDPYKPPPAVLDPNDADPAHSEQTIIAIYVRTGLTAAHPPAPPPYDARYGPNAQYGPYAFIMDGRTSGK